MPNIDLLQPTSIEEAVSLLFQHRDDCKIIAGGTALVIMLRNHLIAPSRLISLGRLKSLSYIRHEPGVGLRIGALTPIREAEVSSLVRSKNPTLAQTFGEVANVRVRNAATVGGNLSEADYASDPPCVLVAMQARVKASSVRGDREFPVAQLIRDFYETSLEPDEILTELIVPDLTPSTRSAYLKYVSRSSEDRPCVGVASVLEMGVDGVCKGLKVVVGAVAQTPQEIQSAEALGKEQRLTQETIEEIADGYAEIDPISDLRGSDWYRKQVIRVLVRRAMQQALSSKKSGLG
jgi:aerobic carbon-monoxide dehydrogenase medium subunit